jgi:hypothetical protein
MLRRWAIECAAKADDPAIKPEERKRLLKMRDALLDLAKNQEWLDEQKTSGQQQQQIQPRSKKKRRPATRPGIVSPFEFSSRDQASLSRPRRSTRRIARTRT